MMKTYKFKLFKAKRNKELHRQINAAGLAYNHCIALLMRILEYVASQHGTRIVKVDRFFPSSQLCPKCGYQNPQTKDLSIRSWTCPKCGEHHDRDRNAARNIHREGLRILAQQ